MRRIGGTPTWRYATPGILLVLVIAYWAIALTLPREAGLMPMIVGTVLLLLVPIDLVSLSDTRWGNWLRERANPVAGEGVEELGSVSRQLTAILWVLAFGAAMFLAGIPLAVFLYIAGSLRYLGKKSWTASLIGAGIVGLGNYLLFQIALGVELYPGVFVAQQ